MTVDTSAKQSGYPSPEVTVTGGIGLGLFVGVSYRHYSLDQDNLFAYTNAIKWLIADPTMQAVDIRRETMKAGNLSAGLLIGGTHELLR